MPDDTLIGRYLHARSVAEKNGDRNLVREIDLHLAHVGYRADAAPQEAARAEERAEAEVKPRRGRPPIHRDA